MKNITQLSALGLILGTFSCMAMEVKELDLGTEEDVTIFLSRLGENTQPIEGIGELCASEVDSIREDCFLCIENLDETAVRISSNCSHKLHSDCYDIFISGNRNNEQCGMCRKPIAKPQQNEQSGALNRVNEEALVLYRNLLEKVKASQIHQDPIFIRTSTLKAYRKVAPNPNGFGPVHKSLHEAIAQKDKAAIIEHLNKIILLLKQ